jgi:NADPH-dependent 2,4-dienoyl-CoA reductase/sulfur reductase-like enzyme
MRITSRGIRRRGPSFRFRFDDREVEAFPGETIAAALVSADVWGLRVTRGGKPRGLFCGMGVCGECSVLVDGVQRRACLEYASEGVHVRPMQSLAPVAGSSGNEGGQTCLPIEEPDLLIVGAGPAGLAAAHLAASAGLDVLVVDERSNGGGQYFKQPGIGFQVDRDRVDRQFSEGARHLAEAKAAGARFLFETTVWSAFAPNELVVSGPSGNLVIKARRMILSPGAYERPHMVPGWTLPGVMTTGAAQTLLRGSQTAPGRRVLVAGNGPLNLQVASELVRAGAEVVALAELAPRPWAAPPLAVLKMLWNAPGLVREGAAHLAVLRAAGVPIHYNHVLVQADGDDKVRRGTIARVRADGAVEQESRQSFEIDSICMGYGFLAQNEIARALGCAQNLDAKGGLTTVRHEYGQTSVTGVFLAGDAGGLGGARIAQAQGIICAAAAAAELGVRVNQKTADTARRLLQRHRAFQEGLWSVYRSPPPPDLADQNTLICRCEEIGRAALEGVLEGQLKEPGAIKRASRLGMGRCQGRYCAVKIAELIEARYGDAVAADLYFAPRSPFKPVTIGSISRSCPGEQ